MHLLCILDGSCGAVACFRKAPGCGLRVLRPAYEFYLTDEWLYAFDHTRLKKVNSLQKALLDCGL